MTKCSANVRACLIEERLIPSEIIQAVTSRLFFKFVWILNLDFRNIQGYAAKCSTHVRACLNGEKAKERRTQQASVA